VKGLVFTTLYDFCEAHFGADMVDDVIDAAALPHQGAYTSVGTYPFEEMVSLISALVRLSGISMPEIMERFGEFCFSSWVKRFPALFNDRDIFDVLGDIDKFHEEEVRRLYPDAVLPSFKVMSRTPNELILEYCSCKPVADLAVGVIRGAGNHLGSPVDVSYENGTAIRFCVRRQNARRLFA